MKIILATILSLTTLLGLAQSKVANPNTGETYILLNEGWVYSADDNNGYSARDADDKQWRPINPALTIDNRLPYAKPGRITWIRLHFRIPEQFRSSNYALMFHQSVASEIYLNGILLKKYGEIIAPPGNSNAYDPRWAPVIVTPDTATENVLAIRFATQQGIRYANYFGAKNPLFEARIMSPDAASKKYAETYQRTWIDFLNLGVLLAISVLHLAFFLMYREQKANLYFSMHAFLALMGTASHVYFYHIAQPGTKFQFANLTLLLYLASSLMILFSTYAFLQQKKGTLFFSWLATGILSFAATFFRTEAGFNASIITANIFTYVVVLITAKKATKTNSMGAYAIITGALTSLIAFVLFIFAVANFTDEILWIDPVNYGSMITLIRSLALPAALSIFLAREFAVTSRNLAAKLKQVEELSAEKLRDEKEKQELLTSRNTWLEQRVTERTQELEHSLQNLKSTQAQLVHSEKMASLGELTAGIAHEIQNPLNFVNNFSEINAELSEEMLEAIDKGDLEEARALATDMKSNQEKIRDHGKRADSIVKGMLQHSRSSAGAKEPTNISALADEYLRLSYHGMRAKDKTFNASTKTDFDPELPQVPVVAQDIGRVLLNLFNNAFYAVNERKKMEGDGFEPEVVVQCGYADLTNLYEPSTAIPAGAGLRYAQPKTAIQITVHDNGTGIPESIKEKIFQPFFTTKPTGQGTGLGLSLSYDIIKAHGGELAVHTKEGEGTAFIIHLPI